MVLELQEFHMKERAGWIKYIFVQHPGITEASGKVLLPVTAAQ